jgi:tetratricopeptide (TPR) repeat protein
MALGLACALGSAAALAAPEPAAPSPAPEAQAAQAGPAEAAQAPAAPVEPAPVQVAPWPPPALAEMPERDAARGSVERAWRFGSKETPERVARTQRVGLDLGLRSLEGPARALLPPPGAPDAIALAEAARELAPALPAAHAAVASARFAGGDPRGAIAALREAVAAVPEHLEARAWWEAAGAEAAMRAAFLWALVFLGIGAVASLPQLLHGLAATRLRWSGPAALAGLGAVALGLGVAEGPAGVLLGLAAIAVVHGTTTKRAAVATVAVLAAIALHAGSERAALGRLALAADPVAVAAHRLEAGLATPADFGIALAAAEQDALAARAVALATKRAGELQHAHDYFARALRGSQDATLHNNAANVEFALGETKPAIALYENATRLEPSSVAYFNLSQAYGRAIRLDEQDRALSAAQALDPLAIARLTEHAASGERAFVTDIAIGADEVFARAEASGAPARLAAALRARFAPGWLGKSLAVALGALAATLAAAVAFGSWLERLAGPRDFYADLARTLRSGVGDSALRVAQLNRLRRRRARNDQVLTLLAVLVPGAAGYRFGRPLLALAASLGFACFAAALGFAERAPADPLAVGELARLAMHALLATAGALYAIATVSAFALRGED